ncbi:MAG: hypothetical protein AW08_03027 [Candidatus Accumulibacter adjunctus]|uniref:Uncharacterized protein n=1 Tax=Candidatus Accumulibacter adjunctus TaxID=1454001 RepID=A0A011MSW0_9PROT|nr:MAG: hypothetical protein AW08_03027 [Candidatus Accumulibacter adjunctus]
MKTYGILFGGVLTLSLLSGRDVAVDDKAAD